MHQYHLSLKTETDGEWAVTYNLFDYSFFFATIEQNLPGQHDNNDSYLERAFFSQNRALGFLSYGMSLGLTFLCHTND